RAPAAVARLARAARRDWQSLRADVPRAIPALGGAGAGLLALVAVVGGGGPVVRAGERPQVARVAAAFNRGDSVATVKSTWVRNSSQPPADRGSGTPVNVIGRPPIGIRGVGAVGPARHR